MIDEFAVDAAQRRALMERVYDVRSAMAEAHEKRDPERALAALDALYALVDSIDGAQVLPDRVDYGGDQSPSFDSVALRIERRDRHRPHNEVRQVLEEVWLP